MKKVSILAVAAFAMFGCSKNVNVNDGKLGNSVGVYGTVGQHNKGSYTDMTDASGAVTVRDGDKFGVFMLDNTSATVAENVLFTYNKANDNYVADYSTTPGSNLTWQDLIDGGKTSLSFHSYYPYDAGTTNPKQVTVTIPTSQTMGTKAGSNYTTQRTITEKDFIFSKNLDNTNGDSQTINFTSAEIPSDRTVKFQYAHALSIVELNVVKSNSLVSKKVYFEKAAISGTSIKTSGKIDLTATSPVVTPEGSEATLEIPKMNTQEELVVENDKNNPVKAKSRYQMLVMPMGPTAGDAEAKLTITAKIGSDYGTGTEKTLTQSFGTGATWEAGKRYRYNIIVSENAVAIDVVSIDNWEDMDGGDIVVTPEE